MSAAVMMESDNDIFNLALKRHQSRTGSNRSAYSSEVIFNGVQNKSLEQSPPLSKKAYQPKGFIAEVTNAAQKRENRMTISLFDDEVRVGRALTPLVVSCECNGKPCYAVIDTTSVVSIMTVNLVNKLGLEREILRDFNVPQNPIIDPGVPRLTVEGSLKYVDLNFNGCKQVMKLYVVKDNPTELVLGIDFLRKSQATINFLDNALHFGLNGGSTSPEQNKTHFLNVKEVQQAVKSNNLQRPSTITLF